MNTGKPDFIVVDDNKVDCFIAEKIIGNSGESGRCTIFHQAPQALEHISSLQVRSTGTIVLVDIQMPVMNGFEFVEAFESLPLEIRKFTCVYVLSSSINEKDILKAKSFSSVKGFLNKPLTTNMIRDVLKDYA